MPLTLVCGLANSGKTGVLTAAVRDAVAAGERPALLLPTYPDVQRGLRELAERGPHVGVTVDTLDRWSAVLWRARGDGRGLVTDAQRSVLMAESLRDADGLTLLSKVGSGPGVRHVLERAAKVLTCERLATGAVRSALAREVVRVLERYLGALRDRRLVEPATAVAGLAEKVAPDWFDGPLLLNRFTDLGSAQERLVTFAANAGADVWIALPWRAGFPATAALDPLVGRLAAAGAEMRECDDALEGEPSELAWLERHLFLDPGEALGAPVLGQVALSLAEGEEAEADRMVAEVRSALERGVEPERIAVVFRDAWTHARPLRRALAEAGIAADYDVEVRFRDTGFGRALAHLLAWAGPAGSRGDLTAFLKTPYSGARLRDVERTEAAWRRRRVTSRAQLARDVAGLEGAGRPIRLADVLSRAGLDADSLPQWEELAGAMLGSALGRGAPVLGPDESADVAAQRAMVAALREMAAIGSDPLSLADVGEALADVSLGIGALERPGRVQVASAHRVRGRRFRYVVIGGMTAGDFSRPIAEDALSVRQTVAELASAGVDVRRLDEAQSERLAFYLTATRASERLVLSRQVADSEGRPLRPAPLLSELLDMYRPVSEPDEQAGLPTSRLGFDSMAEAEGAPRTQRRSLRSYALAGVQPPEGTDARARVSAAIRRAAPRRPQLTDPQVLERLACERSVSVSDIERYLACPYLWFFERAISAGELDREVDAGLIGSAAHDALRRVYRRVAESNEGRVTPANLETVLSEAKDDIDTALGAVGEPASTAERLALGAVRRAVVRFLVADATFCEGFRVRYVEWGFGRDDAPLQIEGVSIRGRVDRIDADDEGRLLVVDYKTSTVSSERGKKNLAKNGFVQLPLYAAAARGLLGAEVAGGLYRRVCASVGSQKTDRGFYDAETVVSGGLVSTDAATREEIDSLIEGALAEATTAVSGMRSGRIPAEPRDPEACKRCRCAGVCGART